MGKTPQDDTSNEHDKLQYKYFNGTVLVRKTSWYQMYMSSLVFCIRCKIQCEVLKVRDCVTKKEKKEKKINPRSKKPSSHFQQGFSIDEALA